MKTIKITRCVIIFLALVNFAFAQEHTGSVAGGMQFENTSWIEVLTKAKQINKPIFVDAYADWCKPCKWMMANVFPTEEAGKFYNANFVIYKLDMEKGEGIEFAKKYEVKSYPSYLYFNPEGELVHRSGGSKSTEKFIEDGLNALNPDMQFYSLKKKFESGERNEDFLYQYVLALGRANLKTGEAVKEYFKTQSEDNLTSAKNWELMNSFLHDIESPAFKYLEKNKASFENLYGAKEVNAKIAMTNMEYYLSAKSLNQYSKYAVDYADKYAQDNSGMLNSIAWSFYENITDKRLLSKAVKWAKRSVELHEEYANADTYAALLYKTGKKDQALKAAERAIRLGKQEKANYSETEILLDKIKAMK